MICGAVDTGKSTLCQILLNYAIRNGNQCIYVDLDCGQVFFKFFEFFDFKLIFRIL